MIRADLHVHSRFSTMSNDWVMKRLGAGESYTDPETIYRTARSRGMDLVTITDHNTMNGVLRLRDNHPDDVLTGVEATVSFPEDGCKVHVLVYGLEENQWWEIDALRSNIYDFREYVRQQNLAVSLAHGVYSVNRKLTAEHLEKLILLFDVFEGLNAGRNRFNSERWRQILEGLSPELLQTLASRHRIHPWGSSSWIKGLTAGSDDHSSIFIARGYTECEASTPEEFVDCIRSKTTRIGGIHNSYRDLALSIYKIGHEFCRSKNATTVNPMIHTINDLIFHDKSLSLKQRLVMARLKHFSRRKKLWHSIGTMIDGFEKLKSRPVTEKIPHIETSLENLTNHLLDEGVQAVRQSGSGIALKGILNLFRSGILSTSLMMPYLAAISDLYKSRDVIDDITARIAPERIPPKPRILWISDTFDHLNGVSVTIQNVLEMTSDSDLYNVKAMVCVPNENIPSYLTGQVINLPVMKEYEPDFYSTVTIRFPSVIRAIDAIESYQPDRIIISTPGPLGLLGLIASKMLRIEAVSIYHTDFTAQAVRIMGDTFVTEAIEKCTRFFYNESDQIKVPTCNYIEMLKARHFNDEKMSLFGRAVDCSKFTMLAGGRDFVSRKFGVPDGFTFLYAGRVSKDKSIDFISDIYESLLEKHPAINLVIAGDGPCLADFKERMKHRDRVVFTGRLPQDVMPLLYSGADALLFPSVTDTFGMVVLEAHACGLPAMVSDIGGPCEIVNHGKTGFVIPALRMDKWIETGSRLIKMKMNTPAQFHQMRLDSRHYVENSYSWEQNLRDLFGMHSDDSCQSQDVSQNKKLTDPVLLTSVA